MMNFILFNVILLVAGFVAVLILSVGLMACFAPVALFAKSGSAPRVVMLPLTGVGALYQIYVWGGWSAFCVAMTIRFTQKPEVTWDWLYWIAGFMECVSPIAWLAHKEQQSSRSLAEVRGIQKGTMLYSLIAIAAFLVFAFVPSLIQRPYGWALTPVGFAYSGSTSPVAQGEAPPREYVDHQYQFAFQFPSDWKLQKTPSPGEVGEVRVLVQSPRKGSYVMALVGGFGKIVTKEQFETSPNRESAVNGLIELTVEQIHKKASRDIGASRMLVSEKRAVPSDVGIKFYISTAHFVDKAVIGVASIHVIPFGKDYAVNFVMISPVDPKATAENEIMTKVFNSFHIVGERTN